VDLEADVEIVLLWGAISYFVVGAICAVIAVIGFVPMYGWRGLLAAMTAFVFWSMAFVFWWAERSPHQPMDVDKKSIYPFLDERDLTKVRCGLRSWQSKRTSMLQKTIPSIVRTLRIGTTATKARGRQS
jgi:hypothetical protein